MVDLVADLPMIDGVTRPVRLQVTVASCQLDHGRDAGMADRWAHRPRRRRRP